MFKRLRLTDLEQVSVIHPSAIISPAAVVGAECTIMAAAITDTEAQLGEGGIVNCGAVVDHHCKVGGFCHMRYER